MFITEANVRIDLTIINRLSYILNMLHEFAQTDAPNYDADDDPEFLNEMSRQALFQHIITDVYDNCQKTIKFVALFNKLKVGHQTILTF